MPRVHRHIWSGRNSFAARERASVDLVNLIKTIVAEDGDARIAIVAHSHGGTIALEAMNTDEVRIHTNAIACLATPVLNVAPVHERGISIYVLWTLAIVGVVLATFGFPPLSGSGSPALPTGPISGLLSAGLVWLLTVKVGVPFYRQRRDLAKVILRSTSYKKIISTKTAFFRYPGDEVTSFAGAIHLINFTLGLLSYLPLKILDKSFQKFAYFVVNTTERFGKNAATYVGLSLLFSVFIVPPLILILLKRNPAEGLWVPLGILLFYIALGVVYLFCRAFGACALSLLFGPELIFAAPELRVTAESCPYGQWTVVYLDERASIPKSKEDSIWSDEYKADSGRYSHGAVYEAWYFCRALADWLVVQMEFELPSKKIES